MKKTLLILATLVAGMSFNAAAADYDEAYGYYTLEEIEADVDHSLQASIPYQDFYSQNPETATELIMDSLCLHEMWQEDGITYAIYEPIFHFSHAWKQTFWIDTCAIVKIRIWRYLENDHNEKLASREVRNVDDYLCYEKDDVKRIGFGDDQMSNEALPTPATFCEAQGIADDGVGDLQTYFGARLYTKEDPLTVQYRMRVYTTFYEKNGDHAIYNKGSYENENEKPYRIWEATGTISYGVDVLPTAVNEVNVAKDVVSTTYYNLQGVESNTPFEGVNIVVTNYNDGSRTTSKVIK